MDWMLDVQPKRLRRAKAQAGGRVELDPYDDFGDDSIRMFLEELGQEMRTNSQQEKDESDLESEPLNLDFLV